MWKEFMTYNLQEAIDEFALAHSEEELVLVLNLDEEYVIMEKHKVDRKQHIVMMDKAELFEDTSFSSKELAEKLDYGDALAHELLVELRRKFGRKM